MDIGILKWKYLNFKEKIYYSTVFFLLIIACILALQLLFTPKIEKFTEFYILDSEGKAENYPRNLTLGKSAEVILGISNHEAQEVEYRALIQLEGGTIQTKKGIKLKHEERWEEAVIFFPNKFGENLKLEFLLYKTDEELVYRTLRLFVNVSSKEINEENINP